MTQLSARIYITVFVAFIAAGCVDQEVETAGGTGDVPLSAEQVAEQTITADLMRDYVRELSDDKYEGRGPGSRGDRSARQYLVTEMEKLGLEPAAADGSWEQTFSLVGLTVDQPLEWTFSNADASLTLKQWDDFVVSSGIQAEWAEVTEAELVFVDESFRSGEF